LVEGGVRFISEVTPRYLMKAIYLKLLRCELLRLEKRGGFAMAQKLVRSLEQSFVKPEYKIVLLLEKARLAYLVGRWDVCLSILDKVEPHERLLDTDDRAFFYILNGRLHQGYGDMNQALSFLEIAWNEAQEGQGYRAAEAALEMASLFNRIGEPERGQDFLGQAEVQLGQTQDGRLSSRLAFEKGLVALREERLAEAEEHFRECLNILGEKNPSVFRGEGLRFLGILACMESRPLDALKLQKEALSCFRALPYAIGVGKAYNSLGQTCLQLGRYPEARFFLEKAMEVCRELGADAEMARIFGKLGLVYSKMGEYEKAIECQKQDLEISSRSSNYRALAFSLRNLGLSYKDRGDLDQAVQYLKDSRDRFAELEDETFQVKADLDLVGALLGHERVTEAWGYLQDAQELIAKRLETTADHVMAKYYAGLVALHTGNYHQAEGCLWQSLEMCKAFSMQARQADVHFHLARLYLAKQDKGAAQEELLVAYRLARAFSRTSLLSDIVDMLHEVEPEALFKALLQSRL
jgi:tetratricopeptide (TPR) repeat protein